MFHLILGVKEKAKKLPLSKQLIFAVTFMVFCVLSVVICFTYSRTISLITRQNAAYNLENLNLKIDNYEKYFKQLKDYSMQLRYNSQLIGIANDTKAFDYIDYSYIASALSDTFFSRSDIVSFKIYFLMNKTCYTITKDDYNVRSSSFKSVNEINNLKKTSSSKDYFYCSPDNTDEGLMDISRIFINIPNRRELIYVEIKIDDSFLRNMSKKSSGSLLCMMDKSDTPYYLDSALDSDAFKSLKASLNIKKENGNFPFSLKNKSYLTVFTNSPDGNWRFVEMVPQDAVRKTLADTRNISFLLAAIAFSVSALLILWLINTQTKSLKSLSKQMSIAGKGDLKTKIDISGNAEVSDLCREFNSMISHIDSLIQKNYIAELNEKTARLKALEAQVNPHFLYNTLQAISAEAVISGQDNIVRMVDSLAKLLRYSVQEDNMVSVGTEIDYVRRYLYLQSVRFDDMLSYLINLDPKSKDVLIPKLSVQMMVENSIMHGFEKNGGQILITVDTKVKDDFLYVFTSDNGSGMTYERLEQVRGLIKNERTRKIGVGIKNLSSQLRILFGKQAHLSIYSSSGRGTNVIMKLPIQERRKSINVSFADNRR